MIPPTHGSLTTSTHLIRNRRLEEVAIGTARKAFDQKTRERLGSLLGGRTGDHEGVPASSNAIRAASPSSSRISPSIRRLAPM